MSKTLLWLMPLSLAVSFVAAEDKPKEEAPEDIPYKVVQVQSKAVKMILVSPKNRNEKDMKLLGEKLRNDFAKEPFCHYFIFDNEKAAVTVRKTSEGPEEKGEKGKFYYKHFIGIYAKNTVTKNHNYAFGLTGRGFIGKKTTIVEYPPP